VSAAAPVVEAPAAVTAQQMPIYVDLDKPVIGPRGPVAVVGDSVMLGSAYETNGWGPSVAQMLVDRGWGPRADEGGGRLPDRPAQREQPRRRPQPLAPPPACERLRPARDHGQLGPNEILACSGLASCAAASIRYFMDVAGAITRCGGR
jgi:hypothetical protein